VSKRHIKVLIEPRDDGGIRVYSDDLPGLILAGRERIRIMADIWPAAKAILEHKGESTDVIIDADFVLPPHTRPTTEDAPMLGKHKFKVGQRVRPSQEGEDAYIFRRKHFDRTGIVTKVDKFNCPTVLWEGRKTASGYYAGFIQPDRRRKRS
jgi:hypothetical protein